jgi:hypothetical protein
MKDKDYSIPNVSGYTHAVLVKLKSSSLLVVSNTPIDLSKLMTKVNQEYVESVEKIKADIVHIHVDGSVYPD